MVAIVTKPELNIRHDSISNKQRYGVHGKRILESETVNDARTLINADRKNILINGDFRIWQRGTSFLNKTSNLFFADRWAFQTTNDISVIKTNVTDLTNFSTGAKLTKNVDVLTTHPTIVQRIENPNHFYGKQLTFSCYVRASKAMTFKLGQTYLITDNGDPNHFGSPYSEPKMINSNWVKLTYTTSVIENVETLPLGSNASLIVYFTTGIIGEMVAGDWYEITGCQVEEGNQVTDFEYRPLAEELELCQRYYQKSYDLETAPGTITTAGQIKEIGTRNNLSSTVGTQFKTRMRTIPTVTLYSPTSGIAGNVFNSIDRLSTPANQSETGISYVNISGGITNSFASYHYTVNAEL